MSNKCVSLKGILSCLMHQKSSESTVGEIDFRESSQSSLQINKNIKSQDIHSHKITERKVKVPHVGQYKFQINWIQYQNLMIKIWIKWLIMMHGLCLYFSRCYQCHFLLATPCLIPFPHNPKSQNITADKCLATNQELVPISPMILLCHRSTAATPFYE